MNGRPGEGRVCGPLLWALLSAGLGTSAAEPQPGPNLITNGGFEEVSPGGAAPAAWNAGDWSPEVVRGTVTAVCVTEGAAEGKAAVKITSAGRGENVVLCQDVVRPGVGQYVLKLKCQPLEGKWASASAVAFRGEERLLYENTERRTDASQWHELSLAFTTPAETERIRIILRTSGGACFDEVSLVRLPGTGGDAAARQEPSTGQELKSKAAPAPAYDLATDEARKARMTPEERAWEKVLEENLGSFYLPGYKQAKTRNQETAWDFVKDDPALPRVLLIGDSISRGYTLAVRRALAGKANLHRAPANCGPTAMGLEKLPVWLGPGKWDLIHVNFGIHDRNSKPEEYVQRLEQLVAKLRATGAKLVWASSTPLCGKAIEGLKQDPIPRLNELAAEVMGRQQVPIDDLYAVALPLLSTLQTGDGCHFTEEGYAVLGRAVAACIGRELALK